MLFRSASLKLGPTAFNAIRAAFTRSIHDFAGELAERGSGWYSESWIEANLQKIADHLDGAMTCSMTSMRSILSLKMTGCATRFRLVPAKGFSCVC